jgi:predicted 3-demethylubiquinone-9 3-methyltransferase (glyoxalase superfamily)
MANIQTITPNLWFANNAEEAVRFYTSVFKNSRIGRISHYGKEGFEVHKMPEGTVLTIEFFLGDQRFLALNGGPVFKFNESISFIINCENQQEIDYYWERLGEGGDPNAQQCGWLKDKFGLSWQVVPSKIDDMIVGVPDARSERVMKALLQMKKLDIAKLEDAYNGKVHETTH